MNKTTSNTGALIETRAEECLRNAKAFSVPVNLERVCDSLDVEVHYEQLEDKVSGVLMIKGGEKHALINAKHHPNRRRFSLAHELGHLVLHDCREDRLFIDTSLRVYQRVGAPSDETYGNADSLTTPMEEREANLFASALLMPEDLVRSQALDLDLEEEGDVAFLARMFSVSDQAMFIRLQQLGLMRVACFS
jgi:Zn-dependent peptidase ImmA (M78 family)